MIIGNLKSSTIVSEETASNVFPNIENWKLYNKDRYASQIIQIQTSDFSNSLFEQ